jgi:hypothetical protein
MESPQYTSAPQTGRRANSRLRVRLPAKIVTLHGEYPVILADLGYFGARVSGAEPPRQGAEVILQWGQFEAFGRVSWVGPRTFGIAFFDPVPPKVLIATRDMDDAGRAPSEKEQARNFARVWASGGR